MPRKAVALARKLLRTHADRWVHVRRGELGLNEPDGDADAHNMRFESEALLLARTVIEQGSPAASLGRKGGKVTSDAKAEAARANGKRGGRPPKPK